MQLVTLIVFYLCINSRLGPQVFHRRCLVNLFIVCYVLYYVFCKAAAGQQGGSVILAAALWIKLIPLDRVQEFAYREKKQSMPRASNFPGTETGRQKRERCQAKRELGSAGMETTQSQPSRTNGKKDLSSGCTGNSAEFTTTGVVKSKPKEKEPIWWWIDVETLISALLIALSTGLISLSLV